MCSVNNRKINVEISSVHLSFIQWIGHGSKMIFLNDVGDPLTSFSSNMRLTVGWISITFD